MVPRGLGFGEAPLRIALVHSFYTRRFPSGENQVVEAQAQALRHAGHEVLVLGRHTDDLAQVSGYGPRAAARVATGMGGDPERHLAAFGPDVVHVHNLFPNIGTAWLARWQGPVVATVHNFRPLCANATLFRDGATCTLCPDGDRWAGVRHACYRDSRVKTLPLAVRNRGGAAKDAVSARADRLVLLADRQAAVYESYGVPSAAMDVIPNFVTDVTPTVLPAPLSPRWIVAGRLTPEKGVRQLVEWWPVNVPLDIVGEGPEASLISGPSVTLLGSLPREELRALLPSYTGLVVPSIWVEGAPQVVVEALEAGIPVVARAGGTPADLVETLGAGAVWDGASPLDTVLSSVVAGGDSLRSSVRSSYLRRFLPERWVESIEECYRAACRQHTTS